MLFILRIKLSFQTDNCTSHPSELRNEENDLTKKDKIIIKKKLSFAQKTDHYLSEVLLVGKCA